MAKPQRSWSAVLAASLLAFLIWAAPARAAAEPPAEVCELHLWGGGYPNRKLPPRLLAMQDPVLMDPTNPLSNATLYNSVNRIAALPEDGLRRLFPTGRSVTIIHHPDMIDLAVKPLKTIRAPLSNSAAACQADLVIANVYAIFPNPDAALQERPADPLYSLVTWALTGSDRLIIDFWMQRRLGSASQIEVFRRKNDCPMPHVRPNTSAMRDAMTASSACLLDAFAGTVAAKSRP